jgi:hypothetical protein
MASALITSPEASATVWIKLTWSVDQTDQENAEPHDSKRISSGRSGLCLSAWVRRGGRWPSCGAPSSSPLGANGGTATGAGHSRRLELGPCPLKGFRARSPNLV